MSASVIGCDDGRGSPGGSASRLMAQAEKANDRLLRMKAVV
jgi:hypothetical protein